MCPSLPQKNTKNRNQIQTRVNFQENPNSYLTFLPIYNYFCQSITRIESLQNTAVLEKFCLTFHQINILDQEASESAVTCMEIWDQAKSTQNHDLFCLA